MEGTRVRKARTDVYQPVEELNATKSAKKKTNRGRPSNASLQEAAEAAALAGIDPTTLKKKRKPRGAKKAIALKNPYDDFDDDEDEEVGENEDEEEEDASRGSNDGAYDDEGGNKRGS